MNSIINQTPSATSAALVLSVAEAAERLKTSQWMIYKLIRERKLVTIKIGSRRLVPSLDLDAYVDNLRIVELRGHHA
ncbi:helix-turn-helix domain-containing protein [Subtercola frigoramans]|uniref:Excisionase family DNA binding protein n=1 Tax=Subtercola frigoramans TaxID=120298 RepID=A0ABS2L617_9MICO|nr:helix-turn-helix domain-containing protein [Subtercola frigoramans]MBM7472507.1 excisionase family DNA binding protein [Subtercola frigoramans]